MAWGYGTTVEDAEVYEGPSEGPGAGDNLNELRSLNKFSPEEATPEEPYITASSSPVRIGPLQKEKFSDKFSFYLDENIGQFGVRYNDSPFIANLNIGQGGQVNWGAQLGGGTGLLNANVGIAGHGTSGSVSPFADINVNPLPGLNFNLQGQSYPGGYSELNPSASYMNQFNTPWGSVDYNIGRQGGRTVGGFNVRGDF